MNLKQRIARGYAYLTQIVNDDGGIPAISEGDVSGVWTTAEALEVIVTLPCIPHERLTLASRMWSFLLSTQLHSSSETKGAWPLVKSGIRGSAMATGHTVAAVKRAYEYFGTSCPPTLEQAAEEALHWLGQFQADDGGWGVEPATPPHGSQPRMISTVYAVLAYTASGFSIETSQNLRKAKQWILSMRDQNGGFRGGAGHEPDPCNTARAIRALIEMRAVSTQDKIVTEAVHFLRRTKPKGMPWSTKTESFVIEGSSGEVVFNSNTPADALIALLLIDVHNPMIVDLVNWFQANQQSNGSWPLTPDDPSRSHICTWSTSEALMGLGQYEWSTVDCSSLIAEKRQWSRRAMIAVTLALALETLLLLRVNHALVRAWDAIPKAIQSLILYSIMLAIVVNLGSSLIYDTIRRRGWRKS